MCYLRHGDRVFETFWSSGRTAEALAPTYALLDMTVYGRQETWISSSRPTWPSREDAAARSPGAADIRARLSGLRLTRLRGPEGGARISLT